MSAGKERKRTPSPVGTAERPYQGNRLADKNYFVTINTVSARRVAKDNLLECTDPLEVKIEAVKGKTTETHCGLIGEAGSPIK